DRIAVMYLGRIVEIGPTERLLEDPKHPYTKALLSVVPEAKEVEQEILVGEAPDPTRIPRGCRFHPRCPLLRAGHAAARGVSDACENDDLELVAVDAVHDVACHAVSVGLPTVGTVTAAPSEP